MATVLEGDNSRLLWVI